MKIATKKIVAMSLTSRKKPVSARDIVVGEVDVVVEAEIIKEIKKTMVTMTTFVDEADVGTKFMMESLEDIEVMEVMESLEDIEVMEVMESLEDIEVMELMESVEVIEDVEVMERLEVIEVDVDKIDMNEAFR